MSVLAVLAVIFLLAFMVETLTEFLFGDLFNKVPALVAYKWTIKYIAVAVGVGGAWVYQFDLVNLLSQYVDAGLPASPFGVVLTGIAIGKGSNYIHQLIAQFFPAKAG